MTRSSLRSPNISSSEWTAQWLADGTGMMAHNGIDAGIKLRPSKEEIKQIGPAFSKKWNDFYANAPDKPVIWLGPLALYASPILEMIFVESPSFRLFGDYSTAPKRKFFNVFCYAEHPHQEKPNSLFSTMKLLYLLLDHYQHYWATISTTSSITLLSSLVDYSI
ncbi:hypothetical protein QCA50_008094 [Cerrena zonata]|uniref:Uncharacterized protein n=1 Tax=Cerrena zonata TaxID=2478898 RepID=A0AAW0G742_9APHY